MNALHATHQATRHSILHAALLAALAAPLALPALADDCYNDLEGIAHEVCVARDVLYIEHGDPVRQALDIWYRPDNPHAKVVLFVPGGGWLQGEKGSYETLAQALTGQHGLTVVVTNYRLSEVDKPAADATAARAAKRARKPRTEPVRHPDHVRDVAAAFGWVKRNIAGYGDPQRVYLFGQSAGAHLVSLAATDPQWLAGADCGASGACTLADIRGVISMSGMYDLPALTGEVDEFGLDGLHAATVQGMYRFMVANAFGPDQTRWAEGSPQTWLERYIAGEQPTPDLPPFLLLYSASDMPRLANEAHGLSVALHTLFDAAPAAATDGTAATARAIDDPLSTDEPRGPIDVDPTDLPAPIVAAPAAPTVELRRLERIDYSDAVWCRAMEMAAGLAENALGDCAAPLTEDQLASMYPFAIATGHWAEVVAINPSEPDNYPTRLVVDFIAAH